MKYVMSIITILVSSLCISETIDIIPTSKGAIEYSSGNYWNIDDFQTGVLTREAGPSTFSYYQGYAVFDITSLPKNATFNISDLNFTAKKLHSHTYNIFISAYDHDLFNSNEISFNNINTGFYVGDFIFSVNSLMPSKVNFNNQKLNKAIRYFKNRNINKIIVGVYSETVTSQMELYNNGFLVESNLFQDSLTDSSCNYCSNIIIDPPLPSDNVIEFLSPKLSIQYDFSSNKYGNDNIASTALISATTTYPGYSVNQINDGDINVTVGGSYSWSNRKNISLSSQSVVMEWSNQMTMSSITVFTSKNYEIRNFDIQYKHNNAWKHLLNVRNNSKVFIDMNFNEIQTNAIRILNMRGPGNQSFHARFNEIEIFNDFLSNNLNVNINDDYDYDKITNENDECPNTPEGERVYSNGCMIPDSDSDGIDDDRDQCPNTNPGVPVYSNGCEILDSDGDGVLDDKDQCPNTPSGVQVTANGCGIDTDEDGVEDYQDQCPNTPYGGWVHSNGCLYMEPHRSTWIGDFDFTSPGGYVELQSECIDNTLVVLYWLLDATNTPLANHYVGMYGSLRFEGISNVVEEFKGLVYLDSISLVNEQEGSFGALITDGGAASYITNQIYGDNLHTIFNNPWAMIGESKIEEVQYYSCTP